MVFSGMMSFTLFLIFSGFFTDRKYIRSFWRTLGFCLLSIVFFLFVLERRISGVSLFTDYLELLALFSFFTSIRHESDIPDLISKYDSDHKKLFKRIKNVYLDCRDHFFQNTSEFMIIIASIITFIVLAVYNPTLGKIIMTSASILIATGIVFKLLVKQKKDSENTKLRFSPNMLFLLACLMFLFRNIFKLFYRLPEDVDIVFLREQTVEYSLSWFLIVISTFFVLILIFNAHRKFIANNGKHRLILTSLLGTTLVSSITSLAFGFFIFQTVETNNKETVQNAARNQQVITNEKAKTAQTVTISLRDNSSLVLHMSQDNFDEAKELVRKIYEESEIDSLRIYDESGLIVVDMFDPRNEGQIADDPYFTHTANNKSGMRTFDTIPGVIADTLVVRSIYPILNNDQLVGAVETAYLFDNAFVDSLKKQTGLDATIFTEQVRSASTVVTKDGTSRELGTIELQPDVISTVIENQSELNTINTFFGEDYYTTFLPVTNVNAETVGMLSAQSSVDKFLNDFRDDLIVTFLIITNFTLLITLVGYKFLRNFIVQDEKK